MKKLKVLLFDSWHVNIYLLEIFFSDYEEIFQVKTAIDFDSACKIYDDFKPEVVVMEHYGTRGLDFLKKIRAEETGQNVKAVVIAATSQNMIGDKEDCLQAGFNAFFPKPVEFKEFKKELSKLIPDFKSYLLQEKKCRVLTVTADPLMSVFLVKPLEQDYPGGALVDITENSNETLNYLAKSFSAKFEDNNGVDVVLLDLDLPGKKNGPNAYQLSMLIKDRYPQIICGGFTTFSTQENQKMSLQAGMNFLFDANKPTADLTREITKALYPV